ncbi:MAG TPA: 2,3-bisphosphoglycerate-independent phosphoglycerate mutase [Acidimicrobiales bacterium]|nr:2,3-bisphosphoglycerate-independent phosphoglycerate mutase [Acidimicrobiales bacterium]
MTLDLSPLVQPSPGKIVLVVLDGLAGFAGPDRGTELEEAHTPNLDALAAAGSVGLHDPVGPGITPGSGPAHMALFGYDPVEYQLGRGALSAAGLEVDVRPGDVAARGNLATLDAEGRITDRRAGRLPDTEALEVVERLRAGVAIPGVDITIAHEAQHRVLVVFRGEGLSPLLSDTDPQKVGVPPAAPRATLPTSDHTAEVVADFDRQVRAVLADHPKANVVLLRGFDSHRALPSMFERFGVRPAAIAVYPMYRGVASLVGMDVLPKPANLDEELALLRKYWDDYDYFFFHHKSPDSAGEDGNFAAKAAAIEALDEVIAEVAALAPDVLVVTGDHSTPSQMAAHSWHPVPVLMWGPRVGRDDVARFGERWCLQGALGRREGKHLMTLMLGASGRLAKFGA